MQILWILLGFVDLFIEDRKRKLLSTPTQRIRSFGEGWSDNKGLVQKTWNCKIKIEKNEIRNIEKIQWSAYFHA